MKFRDYIPWKISYLLVWLLSEFETLYFMFCYQSFLILQFFILSDESVPFQRISLTHMYMSLVNFVDIGDFSLTFLETNAMYMQDILYTSTKFVCLKRKRGKET